MMNFYDMDEKDINQECSIRREENNNLYSMAYMDIDKTLHALRPILEYRKKVCEQLTRATDENHIETLKELLIYSEHMINRLIGIYKFQ